MFLPSAVALAGPGTALIGLKRAGDHVAVGYGTVRRGALAAESSAGLSVALRGLEIGSDAGASRLIAASARADHLNAPYRDGAPDETGFLAWPLGVEITGVDVSGGDTSAGADTGGEMGDPPGGCARASGGAAGGLRWLGLAALAALGRRGRR